MENKTTFYLINEYTGELICKGVNYMDVIKPAFNLSREQNYGLIRYWFEPKEKRLYVDAGPEVFYIIADTKEGMEFLQNKLSGEEK